MLEDIITPPKFSEYFFNELEENVLENIITSSKSPEHLFNELEEELTELFDSFDDWTSVDTFLHNYCLERGFGYQVFRNDKDANNHSIT
ncbi:uncharacterized protein OCT59_007363 [Rhizophagus irregularis]|uniref:uncharacterized protein n=1 Tax=Rhizophagus irregularis TaxID=588596 RepID=UPI001C1CC323|nr:hypothetical protein OCT59_007363 [Rhizophagus irregularis]CAB5180087.1 unnamed protein product [Rhizophagus irregularis]